jgi:DNA end-binding protein Ku
VAMARAIWSGAISFGLVTVPVKLFSATESKTVHFNQFEEGTGERIRYKRVAEGSGEEVDYADIVKGYEIEKGRFVIVTPEELESVEPTKSRTIDIEDFVSLDEIDPVYFDKTYYLAPAPDVGAEKPYALLHEALRSSNKVAVARFVMRTKQYLAAIRPVGDLLALDTMFFPDEVRGEDTVENAPGDVELSDRELAMAEQLIDSLTSPWEPDRYTDTYRERVLDLIERKAKGEDIVVEEQEATPEVADLMAALQASVEEARNRKAGKPVGGRGDGEGAGLDGLTKGELYERASDAGIEGRSKMSKDELADALRREAS